MAVEAVFARGNYGSLELEDRLVAQARGIGQIASDPPYCGNQALVRIQTDGNLMRKGTHG